MIQGASKIDDLFQVPMGPIVPFFQTLEPVGTSAAIKTPVSILEEGCLRIFGSAPKYGVLSEQVDNMSVYVMHCRVNDHHQTEGKGKSKKQAKQIASSKMILLLLEKNFGYAEQLGVPATDIEQARIFIETITSNENRAVPSDFVPGINYVSAVLELCKKNKLEPPAYNHTEEGPPNDRTYTTTCKVGNEVTSGQAKQKKQSKNIASHEMQKRLNSGILANDIDALNIEPEATIKVKPAENESMGLLSDDPQNELNDILQNGKFSVIDKEFKMLESHSIYEDFQCLLKMKIQQGETKTTLIFPGSGPSEDAAREQAVKEALIYFNP